MGQGQTTLFLDQFEKLELQKHSQSSLWLMYSGVTSEAAASLGSGSDSQQQEQQHRRRQRPSRRHVTAWQLNSKHPTYTSALAAPRQKNYTIQWVPAAFAAAALQWAERNPHRHLLNVSQVHHGSELYAVSEQQLVPLTHELPSLHPAEVIYGLCNVVCALGHLHQRGFSHRNLHWGSLYVDVGPRCYWVLGDLHFMSTNDPVDDTGRCSTVDLLNEIRALREAKQLAFVAPEENNPGGIDFGAVPIGTGDVYSFGQLLEQLLSQEKAPHNHLPTAPRGARDDCSPRGALEALRSFSRSCMQQDFTRRPLIEHFLQLPCVVHCAFASVMHFLDEFGTKSEKEKLRFFATLHVEVIKISYDLFVDRLLPRFLTLLMWSDRSSELFTRHLLQPLKAIPAEPLDGIRGAAVASPSASPTQGDSENPRALQVFGLLQTAEYHKNISPFLKVALAQAELPTLLCALFRNVESYVVSVDLSVVNDSIIPSVIRNLRHSCHDVVLEALRAFTVLCKFVFAATDRGADCGTALQQLTDAFDHEVFSLAASDAVLMIRVAALGIAARSFTSKRQLMSPARAIAALRFSLIISADASSTARVTAAKGLRLIAKILEVASPSALVMDLLPALMQLNAVATAAAAAAAVEGASTTPAVDPHAPTASSMKPVAIERQGKSDGAGEEKEEKEGEEEDDVPPWEALRDGSLKLAMQLTLSIRDRVPAKRAEPEGAGGASFAAAACGDEQLETQSAKARSTTAGGGDVNDGFTECVGRLAGRAAMDKEGWLTLRAPCPWVCVASSVDQQKLLRPAPRSDAEATVGAHAPPVLPVDEIELTPHDYDYHFNDAPILTPARVVGVGSTARDLPHPLAALLVTRFARSGRGNGGGDESKETWGSRGGTFANAANAAAGKGGGAEAGGRGHGRGKRRKKRVDSHEGGNPAAAAAESVDASAAPAVAGSERISDHKGSSPPGALAGEQSDVAAAAPAEGDTADRAPAAEVVQEQQLEGGNASFTTQPSTAQKRHPPGVVRAAPRRRAAHSSPLHSGGGAAATTATTAAVSSASFGSSPPSHHVELTPDDIEL